MESALLNQFQPTFMVSAHDCSGLPAMFEPNVAIPSVLRDDGTIYGQAFPRGHDIELHYYHLWPQDCGEMGHHLDAEHAAVLLREQNGHWQAAYWYAASHEDTVCDASQITRASTLNTAKQDATSAGATIWISAGKHASFLNEELCRHGCGGDRCQDMQPLPRHVVVNLGELSHPMNGELWTRSREWPLATKMTRSDFTENRLARLGRLPDTDVAWANPAKRPAQNAILGANSAIAGAAVGASGASQGVSVGSRSTDTALVLANTRTDQALGRASENTGNALGTASRDTGHALSHSFHAVRKALGSAAGHTGSALTGNEGQTVPQPPPKN